MSEPGSSSDEGSSSFSSKSESAMSESSGSLLESCTRETLDDLPNRQTLAIASSSSMALGEGVVFDAIPIVRSEFTADHLKNNLLDNEKQVEALRQSCNIPRSVGIRLVHDEEWPSEPPQGHVMFYTQILLTLGVRLPLHPWLQKMLSLIGYAPGQLNPGFWDTLIGFYIIWMECGLCEPSFHQWRYCYKMRPAKSCTGYAECACRSERERIVYGKKKAYYTWKNRWCFLYNDWEYDKGVTPERRVLTHFQTELSDIEKVLRVPKEDRHLSKLRPLFRRYGFQPLVSESQGRSMEKVSKKTGTSTNKRKAPVLVPSEDILPHKKIHKFRGEPSVRPKSQDGVLKGPAFRKTGVEAVENAAAIVAGEGSRLLPPPLTMEHTVQESDPGSRHEGKGKERTGSVPWKDLRVATRPKDFGDINNYLAGRRFAFDELGEPLAKDESDCDRMLKLSSYVMAEYHDRLQKVERYKAKLKENKQLVDEARKNKGLLTQALQLKDETMESLKRRNGENLRLKKLLEATKKQLEVATLEVSKVRGELDGALVEISELEKSIPTEREAAVQEYLSSSTFHLAIKPYCAQEARFEKRKWMAVLDRYDDGSILRKYHEDIDEHHRKGETFVLAVDPSSEDESDNEGSADAQTQHGEEDLGDAEDDGRTRSDTARGSASDENE
ncbi:hypothetical protein ACFXTH_034460 [Malus domestica]